MINTQQKTLTKTTKKEYNLEQEIDIPKNRSILKRVLSISVPITLGSAVMSLGGLIDLAMTMRQLHLLGYTEQEATAFYGNYTTLAVPMYNLVISLISPISVALLPVIAGYFEVSMDILFDYDVREMKAKIQKIIDGAWDYCFDDTQKYFKIIKDALQEYPGNEDLLMALLNEYEYVEESLFDKS